MEVQTVRYRGALPQLMSMKAASREAKFKTLPTSMETRAVERNDSREVIEEWCLGIHVVVRTKNLIWGLNFSFSG